MKCFTHICSCRLFLLFNKSIIRPRRLHAMHRCGLLLDVARSVVGVSVCVLGTHQVSCAKTAEPIEMPFGGPTRVGPTNYVLDGVQSPHENWHF